MQNQKYKVLVLSDHALSTSGVGTQTRWLLTGLVKKGCWTFRQLGAAVKHSDYNVVQIDPDIVIKPIDGFGNRDMMRVLLATEKPDVIFIFTDPRFFIWLFEMEDEIHQLCPIVWWHVWDNLPYPKFNEALYEATDLINCHSYLTYEMVKEVFPEKTNFIPHAIPKDVFKPLDPSAIRAARAMILNPARVDDFVGVWVNRNARRKRPSDVLEGWKIFTERVEREHGHRKVSLIMHTEPLDSEGPNLFAVSDHLGVKDTVFFSTQRLEFDKMAAIYGIADCCINISYAEGFGLGTLESMQCGTPIVAMKTGGLTRQVVDHRDGSENGVAIPVETRSLVGSQSVPYIYEDYCSAQSLADALWKLYVLSHDERQALRKKVYEYARSEFSLNKTVSDWHDTMLDTVKNWKDRRNQWSLEVIK
jgi:glycosyltransferase involved in cell wall biosynthesis